MPSADPLEPEVLAALEAIDATLADEPVDPEHAELAELALILRDERPVPDEAFLARLDWQVRSRFADPVGRGRPTPGPRRAARRWVPAGALAGLAAFGVAIAVAVGTQGSPSAQDGAAQHAASLASKAAGDTTSSSGAAGSSSASGGAGSPSERSPASPTQTSAASTASPGTSARKLSAPAPTAPVGHGGEITQSARIGLQADPGRIGAVAQEVFRVIGAEHGDVLSSHVSETAGAPGYATFSLQVPATRLQSTLDHLSQLRGARVLTREDASADITAHVDNTAAALAGAQARRRSLLRQLAATAIPAEAARLEREAAQALAEIDRDTSGLQGLRHRVADSTIAITVSAPAVVVHHRHHAAAGGFTFARALHDAGHILLVSAGVALIALAVLVPVGLIVGLGAWVWSFVLRRRREAALGPS